MADRWYEAGYNGTASAGKTLKLHIYTIATDIVNNTTTERSDLIMSVTNTTGNWWNNYGTPAYIGIGGHDITQNVTFDARNYGDKVLIASWDTIVKHEEDGTKTIGISAGHSSGVGLGDSSVGGNYTCDTIPRASTFTLVPNKVNVGDKVEIKINRKSNRFQHVIKLYYGVNTTILAQPIDTSYTWNTEEKAELIYSRIPNENSGYGLIIVDTYDGNTKIGSAEARIDFNVVNANPIFNNFTFKDTNTKTVALTGSNQKIISGYSNVEATISTTNKAVAQKKATMSKYRLQIGTQQIDKNYSDTASVSLTLNNIKNNVIRVYAIDSRGNTTSKDLSPSAFLQYTDIKITNATVGRSNGGVSTEVILNLNGEFWNKSFGAKTNSIKSLKVQYKNTNSSTWIDGDTITPTINNNSFSKETAIKGDLGAEGFSANNSFDIRIVAEDELSTFTMDLTLGSGRPAIAIHKNGVAFGSPYDVNLGGLVQIDGNKIFDSNANCIKYADGTMIEFGIKNNLSFASADYYSFCKRSGPIEISFENTFVSENPIVIPISNTFGVFSVNIVSTALNKFTARVFYPGSLTLDSVNISYIAIGKWIKQVSAPNILPTNAESWEVGTLTTGTGQPNTNNARLRTKDFIPIEELVTYFCSIENAEYRFVNVQYYNTDKNWITSQENISTMNNYQTKEITAPQNTAYIKVVIRRADGANMTLDEFENIKPIISKKS